MTTTNHNGRYRIPVLVLLTLALFGGAFAANRGKDLAERAGTEESSQTAPADSAAVSLYIDNGLWGLRNATGRMLIEPEWYSLRMMSDSVLIARRGGGENDRFGLLGTNGDLIVPLIYSSFHQIADDIWAAEITEGSRERYHLYHGDGTRWQDISWDTCTYENDLLTLTAGHNVFNYAVEGGRLRRERWYSEHAVGLHNVRMEFDAGALRSCPEDEVLLSLGNAAADYLNYLFLTGEAPDSALLTAENPAELKVGYRYRSCTLATANVSRLKLLQTGGYPTYLMQLQVTYKRNHTEGNPEVVNTAMYLTVSRNAAGAYTYSGFTDTQMAAVSAAVPT